MERGRARVPFARGTLDLVEKSILRFEDMGTGNESARKELKNYTSAGWVVEECPV